MKTILIVEDIDLNIDLLTQLLEDEYTLLVAKDGAAGVALAEEKQPDLVIMDIALPVMDGYEATRRIRAKFPKNADRRTLVARHVRRRGEGEGGRLQRLPDQTDRRRPAAQDAAAVPGIGRNGRSQDPDRGR